MKLLFIFSFLQIFPSQGGDDSIMISSTRISGSTACSAVNANNWNGVSYSSFSMNANGDYYRMKSSASCTSYQLVKAEVGFTRFIDSLWQKQSDEFKFQYFFQRKKGSVLTSWMGSVGSQFLNSYLYFPEPQTGKIKKEWAGTFLNPFEIDVGYGILFSFWENSFLNLSIADIKVKTQPILSSESNRSKKEFARLKRAFLIAEYGGSAQWFLFRSFDSHLEWQNNGSIFINGAGADMVNFEMSNKFISKIWKFVQLRLESKVTYNPFLSHRLQFRNEVLLGIFYDIQK